MIPVDAKIWRESDEERDGVGMRGRTVAALPLAAATPRVLEREWSYPNLVSLHFWLGL
jgi:hypothetical protein